MELSNKQLYKYVKDYYNNEDNINFITSLLKNNIEFQIKIFIKILVILTIHKTTSIHHLLSSMIKQYHYKDIYEVLSIMCNNNILIKRNQYYSLLIPIENDLREKIDNTIYPIPLTSEPEKVNKNTSYGSINQNIPVILGRSDISNDKDYNLDLLNNINKIPLSLNNKIINANEYTVKDKSDISFKSYKMKQTNLSNYRKKLKDMYSALNMLNNTFYITNSYDKRGRIYTNGYHINPQGNDYNKAVIEFANKKLITHK